MHIFGRLNQKFFHVFTVGACSVRNFKVGTGLAPSEITHTAGLFLKASHLGKVAAYADGEGAALKAPRIRIKRIFVFNPSVNCVDTSLAIKGGFF